MPRNTRQPSLEKGRSRGAARHPLTAPLRSSPRLHQASRRPTRAAVKFTGRADLVTRQAVGASQSWWPGQSGAGTREGWGGATPPLSGLRVIAVPKSHPEVWQPVQAKEEGPPPWPQKAL